MSEDEALDISAGGDVRTDKKGLWGAPMRVANIAERFGGSKRTSVHETVGGAGYVERIEADREKKTKMEKKKKRGKSKSKKKEKRCLLCQI